MAQLAPGYINPFEEAVRIAREIKQRMKTEVGDYLTCSIGIADNKLVAKIASDLQKPDGLVIILPSFTIQSPNASEGEESLIAQTLTVKGSLPPKADRDGEPEKFFNDFYSEHSDVNSLYSPAYRTGRDREQKILILNKQDLYQKLKLTDIPGIGRRMEKRLNVLGIRTLLDLKNCPHSLLVSVFGINGHHLYNMGQLQGSWKAVVHQEREIKSIGHMYTLPKEFRQAKFFVPVLYKLCEMVGRRLRNKNLSGNIIYFYLRPSTNFFYNRKSSIKQVGHLSVDGNLGGVKIGDGVNDKNYEGCGESRRLDFYIYDGRDIFCNV